MTRIALTLFAAALFVPTLASARGGGGGACRADAQRLCADQLGDRKAVKKCLKANRAELSEACSAKLERRKARRQAFKAACAEDKARLCGDVEPGQGRIRQCMKANLSSLNAECQAVVREMKGRRNKGKRKARRAAFQAACGADKAQFCGDVEPGQGRIRQCIKAHQAELSEGCRDFIAERKAKRRERRQRRKGGE